jgi:hypothetical protein
MQQVAENFQNKRHNVVDTAADRQDLILQEEQARHMAPELEVGIADEGCTDLDADIAGYSRHHRVGNLAVDTGLEVTEVLHSLEAEEHHNSQHSHHV